LIAMRVWQNATGRPMLFAMCEWGNEEPARWGGEVANSWRTTGDISDQWWAMVELADLTAPWFDYAGPGGWNDPDMLEIGNGGMTDVEYRSQMTIWSVLKAPLIIGSDLRSASATTLALLGNADVIAINQDRLGVAGRLVEERPPDPAALQAWAAPLSRGRVAVALWNRGDKTADILCRFVNVQLDPSTVAAVYDVWNGIALADATGQITATVAPHDAKLFVLTPRDEPMASVIASEAEAEVFDRRWAARWRGHGIQSPLSRTLLKVRGKSPTTAWASREAYK